MADEITDGRGLTGFAASKILKSNEFDGISQARETIAQAEARAAQILEQAQLDAEEIRMAARDEGAQGASATVAEYLHRMDEDLSGNRDRLVQVILGVFERIVKPVPKADLVAATVERALEDVDIGRGATLVVAPRLVDALRAHFESRGLPASRLSIEGDPNCSVESSVLRSDFGDIELGIEHQLRAMEAGLRAAVDA